MSSPRRPRPRSYDPAKVRAALDGQVRVVCEAVDALCAAPDARARLDAPTRLGEWTVRELIAHLVRALESLSRRSGTQDARVRAEITLTDYVNSVSSRAGEIAAAASAGAAELAAAEPAAVAARLREAAGKLAAGAAGTDPAAVVPTAAGAMTVADFLLTRLLEIVVHADDLAAATGTPLRHDRQALAAVTRVLADTLAAKAPGGSVEVRIPPFAVVQCVAGPRHTRGTPQNVVETDPLTWLRLATGRLNWADATEEAAVTASGERADISGQLPLLT
ncbi:sterol carrier family protein [Streptomyces sp. NPDC053048]|uniref:sterol carrier family protein n=1 Tax=Streptomyces sp. NPDC053048 TaxID=3365694 RepID=UPI0037D0AEAC